MNKNYKKNSISTNIRAIHGKDSFLAMSLFNSYFSLRIGGFNERNHQYDNSSAQTMTVHHDGAAFLYQVAMDIIDGKHSETELQAVYRRTDTDAIILENKREHSRMVTCLIIKKNGRVNSFEFLPHPYKTNEDGQVVTKFIQSGLIVFAKTLDGYLTGIGADRHLSKLPEDYENSQDENNQFQTQQHNSWASEKNNY